MWPPLFLQRMNSLLGNDYHLFLEGLSDPPATSLRLNPEKGCRPEDTSFPDLFGDKIPWCDQGYYLNERPVFTLDPLFHAGAYYVQEASSMFLQTILRQISGEGPIRALDLCAAPGGKTTLLASNLPEGSLLVANEVIKSRAAILKENCIKWGSGNIVVTSCDPSRFSGLKGAFDLLIVDAPCSGEGLFRKDPKSVDEWSENNLHLCEERQKRILSDSWECLAPGGHLIYSTCTYNPGENEKITEWLIRTFNATPVAIQHIHPGITAGYSDFPCYRFYPHKIKGEGFFTAILQKKDGAYYAPPKEKKNNNTPKPIRPAFLSSGIKESYATTTYQAGNTIGILPRDHEDFIRHLGSQTGTLYKGCEIGETINGKFKPSHALAMFAGLQQNKFATQETDLKTALNYLRKEELYFTAPAGEWLLITYRSIPLGWMKSIGNRLNNYYPKEWRIKNL